MKVHLRDRFFLKVENKNILRKWNTVAHIVVQNKRIIRKFRPQ